VCEAEFDLCEAVIHVSLYFFFTTERKLSRYKGHTKRQGEDNAEHCRFSNANYEK
jgi:hypothetical protein